MCGLGLGLGLGRASRALQTWLRMAAAGAKITRMKSSSLQGGGARVCEVIAIRTIRKQELVVGRKPNPSLCQAELRRAHTTQLSLSQRQLMEQRQRPAAGRRRRHVRWR